MAITITLDDDVWEALVRMKLDMKEKSYSDVLRKKLKLNKKEQE